MVRKKKDIIKPVVAKPLNDTEKRNLVTSFVTNSINESATDNDTNNSSEDVTDYDVKNVTENVNTNDTNIVTIEDTKLVTDNDTTEVTKNVTKKVTKSVNIIKSITLGKKDIIAKFTSDKKLRPNYNLSEDTIEKIEKISDILGYKKAEFVDIYLNGTLEKVLKDLEKNLYK
ncbi:hypothetical protein [Clostridium chromiireducens]|uniref:hypothetical protein n=1 Tax=Clostridium chromiireducens TaxID=225345 RepID=UPI001923DFDE|nr:hypothetical protein [Clostridium chromiireducens]